MNKEHLQFNQRSFWTAGILLSVFLLGALLILTRSSAARGGVKSVNATAAVSPDIQDANSLNNLNRMTDEIVQLADMAQLQNQKCRLFLDRIQAMSSRSKKKEYFVSRTSAIAVLREASRYPGTPMATSEALDDFMNLPAYPTGQKLADLQLALNRLGDCYSAEYYGVLTRLIDPRTRAYFSDSELKRERYLVLNYIQREAASGPKFFVQVRELVDLFDRGIREGLISPAPETRITIGNLEWTLTKIRTEGASRFKKIEELGNSYPALDTEGSKLRASALDDLSWQLTEAQEIQDDLSDGAETELENLIEPYGSSRVAGLSQGI